MSGYLSSKAEQAYCSRTAEQKQHEEWLANQGAQDDRLTSADQASPTWKFRNSVFSILARRTSRGAPAASSSSIQVYSTVTISPDKSAVESYRTTMSMALENPDSISVPQHVFEKKQHKLESSSHQVRRAMMRRFSTHNELEFIDLNKDVHENRKEEDQQELSSSHQTRRESLQPLSSQRELRNGSLPPQATHSKLQMDYNVDLTVDDRAASGDASSRSHSNLGSRRFSNLRDRMRGDLNVQIPEKQMQSRQSSAASSPRTSNKTSTPRSSPRSPSSPWTSRSPRNSRPSKPPRSVWPPLPPSGGQSRNEAWSPRSLPAIN
eukprot:gnl/MRDRNA2_/MRDRNA2_25053_c0_seq1.p1 gnl/MRDRNA2_/MRDRNA2_25053_c0~~gnl/MRDRNA2_/MRDRNA2_25053_c0_seq1.p1  ORF type:complete len:321 (-),score=25.02 gnl/MRDRNA2_/MRDRNA2_25053_c0_seq1:395-1357(-)